MLRLTRDVIQMVRRRGRNPPSWPDVLSSRVRSLTRGTAHHPIGEFEGLQPRKIE